MKTTVENIYKKIIYSQEDSNLFNYFRDCVYVYKEAIDEIVELVRSKRSIAPVIEKLPAKVRGYFIKYIFLELFTRAELKEWIFNLLYEFMDSVEEVDPEECVVVKIRDFYRKSLGVYYNSPFLKDLQDFFFKVLDEFYSGDLVYRRDLQNFIQAINQGETLQKAVTVYRQRHPYIRFNSLTARTFIEKILIPEISEEKFIDYLSLMGEKYHTENFLPKNGKTNKQYLFLWIFGFNLSSYQSQRESKAENNSLLKLFYKAEWPYICLGKISEATRKKKYEELSFNESEKAELEQIYHQFKEQTMYFNTDYLLYPQPEDNTCINGNCTVREIKNFFKEAAFFYKSQRKSPSLKEFTDYIQSQPDHKIKKAVNTILNSDSGLRIWLKRYLCDLIEEIKEFLAQTQLANIPRKEDHWKIFYHDRGKVKLKNYNFSAIKSQRLKNELKMLAVEELKLMEKGKIGRLNLTKVIKTLLEFQKVTTVESFRDLTKRKLKELFVFMDLDLGLSPGKITEFKSHLSFCYQLMVKTDYPLRPQEDYASCFRFHCKGGPVNNTPVIPGEVLSQIQDHLDEIPEYARLIFKLLIETGWRSYEVLNLKVSDFTEIKEFPDYIEVTPVIEKTRKARIARGLSAENPCFIRRSLFKEIDSFIQKTSGDRKRAGTSLIFFSYHKNRVSRIPTERISKLINQVCQKYDICDADGKLWHFYCQQTRKTTLSRLITAGASLSDVQRQAGHLSDETTAKYYAEVHKLKLGELNNEFFKQAFKVTFNDKQLDLFTPEERQILYLDFVNKNREVEFGICVKHPTEGTCLSLGYSFCATCPKLCTGKKYRDKWLRLKDDASYRLKALEKHYEKEGIVRKEYSEFREYMAEKELYQKCLTVLEAIDND